VKALLIAVIAALALPAFFIARRGFKAGFGAAMCFLFQRLGATFIKIGQILSTRPDIFSPELTAPLVRLQDQVPPFRFSEVRRAIEEDFGRKLEDVFAEIADAPIASASIAQVHRAVLRDAELPPSFQSPVVAIKVRRPAIVRRARLDEAILEFGARFLAIVPSFSLISPVDAVRQFCDAVNKQLDFRVEAENNNRFRKNFENDPHIVIPALVEQLCSDRVLTMEFIEGVKEDKIRAVGDDPEFIARKGTEAIVRMIFQHGFVHADLHQGNLRFLSPGRVMFLDVGLVGHLDDADRLTSASLLYSFAVGDGETVGAPFYESAPHHAVVDYAAYEREMADYVRQVHRRGLGNVQIALEIGRLFDILRRHRIQARSHMTMVNLALMTAEGMGKRLDPTLQLNEAALPYLAEALGMTASAAD